MTHKLREVRVDEYAYVNKTSPKRWFGNEYDVKLWRHKQRTSNKNDHLMPLNEKPPMKFFCVRHCQKHINVINV